MSDEKPMGQVIQIDEARGTGRARVALFPPRRVCLDCDAPERGFIPIGR
jgi:hypothetical protein